MTAPVSPRTALVVEDEPLLADVIKWALEEEGYEVEAAATGDEAAQTFTLRSFDLMITDIRMPGKIDGWALANVVRNQAPTMPIVFMSGYTPNAPSLPPYSIFLQKPFRPEQLLDAVAKLSQS
jgi:CheY-like chemotaxis protein